jgi:hypothetical protein
MRAIDQLNARFWRGTIGFGMAGERENSFRRATLQTGTSCCEFEAGLDGSMRRAGLR